MCWCFGDPVQRQKKEENSSSLAHAEWCFNYLNWNDNQHPSHPWMKQIKRLTHRVTSFFLKGKPHIAYLPQFNLFRTHSECWHFYWFHEVFTDMKQWIKKWVIWESICLQTKNVCMSRSTSLTVLNNEYTSKPFCSLPSLLRFSIWCSKCCSALIIYCLKSDVHHFFNFQQVVDMSYRWK